MITTIVADFEQIVNDYERSLRNFARRILGNREDAEEVVQDAFLRAHRALSRMSVNERGGLRLKAWLYTVTLNAARNRLRKKRPLCVSLDTIEESERLLLREVKNESPEFFFEQHFNRELIEGAILAVPEHHRAAARLRFIDGLTHTEIAKRFSQPVGTVKSRVHRAALVMRRFLVSQLHAA